MKKIERSEIKTKMKIDAEVKGKILRALEKPKTIPEVAREIGLPPEKTLWYVISLKIAKRIIETGVKEDYILYHRRR